MVDRENIQEKHIPVLLNELINSFEIKDDKKNIIVDCTLWMWWHASKILDKMNKDDTFIWFDADIRNLKLAKVKLEKISKEKWVELILINSNFKNLKEELEKKWIKEITWIYYDLWLSSLHLDEAERWFSFMLDWPLDMRLDNTRWKSASIVVNSYTQAELREIFIKYWEEPWSNKIAAKIVEYRRNNKKIETTAELSEVIWGLPKTKSRIFQAIRIEVNKELEAIEVSIKNAVWLLKSWGKIFIISFHSLEDRIVKHFFKQETKDCICSDLICSCKHTKTLKLINKKPIIPSEEEIKQNTRSRSAKARSAQKI